MPEIAQKANKKMTITGEVKRMNVYTSICLGITIAGFIGGIITTVAKLAMKTGRIMENMQANEKRDTEERQKNSSKFAELYNRMSTNESNLNAIKSDVNNLMNTCGRIESKLDRIIEREAK